MALISFEDAMLSAIVGWLIADFFWNREINERIDVLEETLQRLQDDEFDDDDSDLDDADFWKR